MISSPFPQAIPTTNYNNAEEDKVETGRATMLKEPGFLSDDMEQNSRPPTWTLEATTRERNTLLSFKTLYLWGLLGQLGSVYFLLI